MSLALIQETGKEVRRLAIAGSGLSVGDFRLRKLVDPLTQAGQNVPAFAQVAQCITEVIDGNEKQAAANLLRLSSLINAILYTLGQSGTKEKLTPLPRQASPFTVTKTSARVLKPLIEALTSTGSGRFETVREGRRRGAFKDLRLVKPAVLALNDNYPELADFVADKILPDFGPGITPLVKSGLNLKGSKKDARRLRLLKQIDPQGIGALSREALDSGSAEIRAAAVETLADDKAAFDLLMQAADDKNKDVRGAALKALARHNKKQVAELLLKTLKDKAVGHFSDAFRIFKGKEVASSVLGEARETFAKILDKKTTNPSQVIFRFQELLACLPDKLAQQKETFLLECFDQRHALIKVKAGKNSYVSGLDLLGNIGDALLESGSQKAREVLVADPDDIPTGLWHLTLQAAAEDWSPKRFFERFSPCLSAGGRDGKARGNAVRDFFESLSSFQYSFWRDPEDNTPKIEFDPRWVDAGIKANLITIVFETIRPGHKKGIEYLTHLLAKTRDDDNQILDAIIRAEAPTAADLFVGLVKKRVKARRYYELGWLFQMIPRLPASARAAIEQIPEIIPEESLDDYLVAFEQYKKDRA